MLCNFFVNFYYFILLQKTKRIMIKNMFYSVKMIINVTTRGQWGLRVVKTSSKGT